MIWKKESVRRTREDWRENDLEEERKERLRERLRKHIDRKKAAKLRECLGKYETEMGERVTARVCKLKKFYKSITY